LVFCAEQKDGGATRLLSEMGVWRNSTETQQSGHTPRSEPEVKNGRSSAMMAHQRGSDAEQSRRK